MKRTNKLTREMRRILNNHGYVDISKIKHLKTIHGFYYFVDDNNKEIVLPMK